jgi:hypothetical protein
MTLDEAKAMLEAMRNSTVFPFAEKAVQALDIALWLIERQHLIAAVADEHAAGTVDEALTKVFDWEAANPKPWGRPDPCPHNPKCMSFEKCCR